MRHTLQHRCPHCNKNVNEKSRYNIGKLLTITLECGHTEFRKQVQESSLSTIKSKSGKVLYPFQERGVNFIEKANLRVLLADEMGLGKTGQTCVALLKHPEALPAIIICKSAVKYNWLRELVDWGGTDLLPQVIVNSNTPLLPGFKTYIVSFDMLRRMNGKLLESDCKTLVVDECQLVKNRGALRTQNVQDLMKNLENIIALSGTPIKNRMSEYYNILNLIRPEVFSNYEEFERNFIRHGYRNGKWVEIGLKNADYFAQKTSSFVIRRTREEVLPELPLIDRSFYWTDLGPEVAEAYDKEVRELIAYAQSSPNAMAKLNKRAYLVAKLARLRHLTGISKINTAIDFTMEFLGSTNRKLVLFVHHKEVLAEISAKLDSLCKELGLPKVLTLVSGLTPAKMDEVVLKFQGGDHRVLIASTLSGGEGINLQSCADCVMVERQWNPSNEMQAESRFARIGQVAKKIKATYLVALGTIDEYFTNLVERKRGIINSAMNKEDAETWDTNSIMQELVDEIVKRGVTSWKMG